jgi:hypothetical protein
VSGQLHAPGRESLVPIMLLRYLFECNGRNLYLHRFPVQNTWHPTPENWTATARSFPNTAKRIKTKFRNYKVEKLESTNFLCCLTWECTKWVETEPSGPTKLTQHLASSIRFTSVHSTSLTNQLINFMMISVLCKAYSNSVAEENP